MHFRSHPLDRARLFFDRTTGVHVRLEGPDHAGSVRRAPRVVQLGLTNRCNLRCAFCFRDRSLASSWTADEILAWAKQLADAGVLEIGFGQGEPLVFPGFPALVRALARETPLAVNFTTNGLLLDAARLDELDGAPGQIRLSCYDDNDPLVRVRLLASRGARFGVNLLVTPARLPGLERTIAQLVAAGCRDVLLLSYNGPDRSLHLSPSDDRALARVVLDVHGRYGSALSIGLSVCFGRRLSEVPQLRVFGNDDCAAGDDFITIDSQKQLLPCSFHGAAIPVDSPAHALEVWRANRARRSHAGIEGCSRSLVRLAREAACPPLPRVLVWQAYASNHSTSYTLVGEFSSAEKSAAYVAEIEHLLERCRVEPTQFNRPQPKTLWQALGREDPPPHYAWHAAPYDMRVFGPETVLAGGRRVLVHAHSTLRTFDIFAHLLLRRHGRILQTGGSWYSTFSVVFGVLAGAELDSLGKRLAPHARVMHAEGSRLYGIIPEHAIEYAAPILRALPRSIAIVYESDETLEYALGKPMPLPPRKRRVEWVLLAHLMVDNWRRSLDELREDPVAKLANIGWQHPFRLPERLDAWPLLGHTLVRSEGAPFPGALQEWFSVYRMQVVARPELRIRMCVRRGREDTNRPFGGLGPGHVASLSKPGGSFVMTDYDTTVNIIPNNPMATLAQLEAIVGDIPHVQLDIMPERPLADALARINADLDEAQSSRA